MVVWGFCLDYLMKGLEVIYFRFVRFFYKLLRNMEDEIVLLVFININLMLLNIFIVFVF